MGLIIVVLLLLVVSEAWVIFELLNRVLTLANVRQMTAPSLRSNKQDEPIPDQTRKHLFTVDIPS